MITQVKSSTAYFTGTFLIGVFLFFIRAYELDLAPLTDYDAVKNYMLAKQLYHFDFSDLFYHASPTLNLFNGLCYAFLQQYVFIEYVHAMLNVCAIFLLVQYISKKLHWDTTLFFLCLLLAGTSLTMVNTSRYLSMEALSLFLFSLFFRFYADSFFNKNTNVLFPGLLLGLLFTVNYKALLILPVVLLIEFIRLEKNVIKRVLTGMLGFLIPCVCYALISIVFFEFPLKYPSILYAIMFIPDDHPYRDINFFNTDWLYYMKYFLYYEGPVLVLVLFLFPVLYIEKLKQFRHAFNLEAFIAIFVYCFILGMSLIQKAPRGLLFIYPLLYVLVLLCFKKLFNRKWFLVLGALLIITYNMYAIKTHIYAYASTNYRQLSNYISEHNISNIASYVGMGAYPFIEDKIQTFQVLHHESEIPSLKKTSTHYLIVDDYYKLACMELSILLKHQLVYEAKEPSLLSPLLALEQSEYSGLSFEESLDIRKAMMLENAQLKLYRLDYE